MTPSSLDFGGKYAQGDALRRFRRALADIVDAVGLGIAADAVGCQKAHLRQAVDGADSRYVAIDHVMPLLMLAPGELRAAALDAWLACIGLRTAPLRARSVQERLADLEERVLGELGPTGARIVEDERSRP
jgi:hypothetical protein